jgi:hypothetical protein
MKNEAEDLFKISFGNQAAKDLENAFRKDDEPAAEESNPAIDFVDAKIIGNQVVPNFGGGVTYNKLFKLYREGESLPGEIDDVLKFRKWYLENSDNTSSNPIRNAA